MSGHRLRQNQQQQAGFPAKFPTTPLRAAPTSALDKTPRHAHGDVKSAQTSSPNAATGSQGSDQKTSPAQEQRSPDADAVRTALQRCSQAAAERRRLLSLAGAERAASPRQAGRPAAFAVGLLASAGGGAPLRPPLYAAAPLQPPPAPFLPASTPLARPDRHGRRSPGLGRASAANMRKAPSMGTPPTAQTIHMYYRDLITELNSLDQLVRYGAIDFVPAHANRLLSLEIERVQREMTGDANVSATAPTSGPGLNAAPFILKPANGSVLETIGQPPLRVPPAMLARSQQQQQHRLQQLDEESEQAEEEHYEVDDEFEIAKRQNKQLSEEAEPEVVVEKDCDTTFHSEVSSVEADTAIEPDEVELQVATRLQAIYQQVQESPWNRASPQSAKSSTTSAAHRAEPILEVADVPQLKITYPAEMPADLAHIRRMGAVGAFPLCAKVFIPRLEGYNFIGRIIGPRGISVRRLETETGCKILIRGKGSIKDPQREEQMRTKEGWHHLKERLHVLVIANDTQAERSRARLRQAVESVRHLLTPQYDEYKRQQLMQLAIINGTYRP